MSYALCEDAADNIIDSDVLPHLVDQVGILLGDTNQATIWQHIDGELPQELHVELHRGSTPQQLLATLTKAAENLDWADNDVTPVEVELTLPAWAINALAADFHDESDLCILKAKKAA